jgi:hypothetical protein
MGTLMSLFPDFEAEYGPAEDCLTPGDDAYQMFESQLPADLLALWREEGWCAYRKGLIWTVDPRQFEGIIDEWVDSTGPGKPIVFMRTAFAHLYFWHDGFVYSLDVQRGDVSQVTKKIKLMFTLLCDPEIKEKIVRASLFQQALPLVGSPARDECYAFEPALALGGPGTVDTVRRVKIREHLGILAQLLQ